jgi:alpha-tubulin suppressor-like RCC1 family protein
MGINHTVIVTNNGKVFAAGKGNHGELGENFDMNVNDNPYLYTYEDDDL